MLCLFKQWNYFQILWYFWKAATKACLWLQRNSGNADQFSSHVPAIVAVHQPKNKALGIKWEHWPDFHPVYLHSNLVKWFFYLHIGLKWRISLLALITAWYSDALPDFVLFVQFKKHEKQLLRSVHFSMQLY